MPNALSALWTVAGAPLLTALLAMGGAWIAISFDRRKTLNQELIRKRIVIYEEMAPKLNDLLCFGRSIGRWKSLTPFDIIDRKRDLDRLISVYGALFSGRLARRYHAFIDSLFLTYQGFGVPAKFRVPLDRLKAEWKTGWKPEWEEDFAPPNRASSSSEIKRRYDELMDQFAVDIGARHVSWLKARRRRRED
jgi:hypothetical protein